VAGSPLSAFTRFQDITGPTYLTSREEVINDAQKRNFRTCGYLLRGQQMSEIVQGGSSIRDNILLSVTRVTHSYLPGDTEIVPMPQTGTTWTVPWRFWITPLGWTDQQIELNDVSGDLTHIFKKEWFRMQQDAVTDQFNYLEDCWWATPNKLTMEAAGGQEMYSIPCFITQETTGLPAPGAGNGGTWTTVMNIDPTVAGQANWNNTRMSYPTLLPVGSVGGLVSAFDKVYDQVDFAPPPMKAEYFESPMAEPAGFIACSAMGKASVRFAYRSENDRWLDFFDPYGAPTYGGRPFVYVAQLDNAALYPPSSGNYTTEALADITGPRFYGIHPKYLRMIWKSSRFMQDLGVFTDPSTPTTHARFWDNWGNLACRSRIRQFIVYPSADVAPV
jgi:hypothetical protein